VGYALAVGFIALFVLAILVLFRLVALVGSLSKPAGFPFTVVRPSNLRSYPDV
jgi:hypothetical protein